MTKDEALELALEVLEELQGGCTDHDDGTVEALTVYCPEVIDAIKEALAQPAQEPVGTLNISRYKGHFENHDFDYFGELPDGTYSVYTAPPAAQPQRPWVGLTDEDIEDIFQIAAGADEETHIRFARAIESALRSKNK